jgi:hypothetical protein
MIASWRGVAVAAALAIALAIVVAVDLGHTPDPADRALVPGFDPDRVTELIWERAGQAAIHAVRDAPDSWETRTPARAGQDTVSRVPVDPGAIADVLAALRGARWHRRGDPGPVHATLTIISGARHHIIGIGEPIAGGEQTWIVDDGRGTLVDSWVARALDRDLFALRIKAPLAGIRRAGMIAIADSAGGHVELRIAGNPRQLTAPSRGSDRFLIAADIADELERALGDVTLVRLPDRPGAAHGLAITAADPGGPEDAPRGAPPVVRVVLGGSCPGAPELVVVSGTLGDGCIEPAARSAIDRAIGRLQQLPEAVVERRPIPFEPARVVLADGVALDTTALRVADVPADPARVAELLAALAAPAEVARAPAPPAVQHLVVTGRAGVTLTLDLFADHTLARHGEPIALRPAPGAWSLLVRPSRELRDVTPWLEEPTTITGVRIDDVRYQRGAIIGDWTRLPAAGAGGRSGPTIDSKTLEALVALLAAPRSLGFLDGELTAVHRVTLTITPPAGAPTEHVLALGAPRAAGCPVRADRDTILLPATVCAQVATLAQ